MNESLTVNIKSASVALYNGDPHILFQKTLVKSLFGGVITNNVVSLVSWFSYGSPYSVFCS